MSLAAPSSPPSGEGLRAALAEALARPDGGFALLLRPRIALGTRRCIAAEAVLGWRDGPFASVPPADLAAALAEPALALAISDWLADSALREAVAWARRGRALPVSVAMPFSALADPQLAVRIRLALLKRLAPPNLLELRLQGAPPPGLETQLEGLRDAGIGIGAALGLTVPSSLATIGRDRLAELASDRGRRRLGAAILAARAAGKWVAAGGVRDRETATSLLALGCDRIAGPWCGAPLPPDSFASWLASSAARSAA